ECFLRALVFNQFDCPDEPNTAHLADERVLLEPAQAVLQSRRDAPHLREDVALLVDLESLDRNGGTDGVTAVSVAMGEGAELCRCCRGWHHKASRSAAGPRSAGRPMTMLSPWS